MNEPRKIESFEDLDAWKACRALRLFVARKVVPLLPKSEDYRLKDQLLRSSRSTTANLAEGYGRFHFKDNLKYVRQARGSAYEVIDHLITACDEHLVDPSVGAEVRALAETAIKLLNGYSRYLTNAGKNETNG